MLDLLLFLLVVAPLGLLLHELGHLLVAMLVRVRECRIQLGVGPVVYESRRMTVRLAFFVGGSTAYQFADTDAPNVRLRIAFISLGGPLLNLLSGWLVGHVVAAHGSGVTLLSLFSMFNIWLAVMNLIPFKVGQFRSDGWLFGQHLYLFWTKRGD